MTRATDYTNDAQQRLMRLTLALFSDPVNGYPPAALAKAVGVSASTITRDLDNLRTAGWAELTPKGDRWRLTPHVIQISARYATALGAGAVQWHDTQQNYGRVAGLPSALLNR